MKAAVGKGAAFGFLLIIASNLMSGLCYPAQKVALEGLGPGTVAFVRTAVGFVPLAIWAWYRGFCFHHYDRSERRRLFAAGSLAYAGPILLGIIGLERSTSANASILILLEPATIVLAAWLVLREHVGVYKTVGVVLGLLGACVIVLEDASPSGLLTGEHLTGNLILALHAVLWGFYTPLIKPLMKRHDAIGVTVFTFLFAMPALLPFAILEWDEWSMGPAAIRSLWWSAGLGIFLSFLGTVFWVAALRHLRAATVAPFILLQPFAGVLAAVWWLGEGMTAAAIVGGAIIATAVLVSMGGREP